MNETMQSPKPVLHQVLFRCATENLNSGPDLNMIHTRGKDSVLDCRLVDMMLQLECDGVLKVAPQSLRKQILLAGTI